MKYASLFLLLVFVAYSREVRSTFVIELLPLTHNWTGKDLAWRLEPVADLDDAHAGMGYIMGVADTISGASACYPIGALQTAIFSKVSEFITAHPARMSEPASSLISEALSKAFPCNKKKP